MAFKGKTIATRLLAGFAAVLVFTLALGMVSIHWINSLADTTSVILEHPFTVSVAIATIKSEVLTNQIALEQLAGSSSPEAVKRLAASIEGHRAKVDSEIVTLRQSYLGAPGDVDFVVQALNKYREAGNHAIALALAGERGQAAAVVEDQATPALDSALKGVQVIISFAANRAARFRQEARLQSVTALRTMLAALLVIVVLKVLVAIFLTRSIGGSLKVASRTVSDLLEGGKEKVLATEAVAAGDLDREIQLSEPLRLDLAALPKDDLGILMRGISGLSAIQASLDVSFRKMTASLREAREEERLTQWLKTGLGELDSLMRGEDHFGRLSAKVLDFLAAYLGAGAGALYVYRNEEPDQVLELAATHAASVTRGPRASIRLGEGLIGQAAKEGRMITLEQVPQDYLAIESALGSGTPRMVVAVPFSHDRRLIGVLELATFKRFTPAELGFLERAMEALAVGLQVNLSRQKVNELLAQSQTQEEELRVQQEELQQTNEELEERAQLLEQQREQIRAKGQEVERVSTYKSQFLANMSHELRTPLNSLMILSGLLKDNKDGNLTPKQVEFAGTINSAGKDLLDLINDILDLSKIEAGRVEFSLEEAVPGDLCDRIETTFRPMAEHKALAFSASLAEGTPPIIRTDVQRCLQILKNLVSNAIKFTPRGSVTLQAYTPGPRENPLAVPAIAFQVRDTGIGIPSGKHETVFKAFQQADGTTSRRFGGTGLGLSISRQLARGLGGEILLSSEEGVGTVVSLYLPAAGAPLPAAPSPAPLAPPAPRPSVDPVPRPSADPVPPGPIPDDRDHFQVGKGGILIVEDDLAFAGILLEMVRMRGFAGVVAGDGPSGLAMAESLLPSAIILDVMLPGLDGWEVMRRLGDNLRTRHIPVHFLSCLDGRQKALAMGAIGFVTKPATSGELEAVLGTIEEAVVHGVKKLLIVEDDPNEARSLLALLQDREIDIQVADTGAKAIELLSSEPFYCIVLDLGLSDMSGFDLLAHLQKLEEKRRIPVIIHSGRDLSREDENRLQHYAESIIIKGAKSPERLLNEVTLFLHVVETHLAPEKQRMIRSSLGSETVFEGKKVLIVDDDMRNVFSLSSLLAERNMVILEAENGKEALAQLEAHPDTHLVLMDIMMPEMDGYQATRAIRQDSRFTRLPIIALTAKAMKGDRDACIQAGASDYIAKPIDQDRLLSLLRVWLYHPA
jgi:CheY-like chemotaxis protein/signal transduction histidine kinase